MPDLDRHMMRGYTSLVLLITDLDNTLYDWVTYFSSAFKALVDALLPLLAVDRETVLDDFRRVHQMFGDSEVPFAAIRLDAVQRRFSGASPETIAKFLQPAFQEFSRVRKQHLQLYQGVEETLERLSERGVTIVGHTEALVENANYRLQRLGIIGLFTRVYALDRPIPPHPFSNQQQRFLIPEDKFIRVPPSERKPNPMLLKDICAAEGVSPHDALYVGDSLTRDMSMARGAGVISAWARYGLQYERSAWETLVRVTHWTTEDLAREARLRESAQGVEPDYTLTSFSEVLDILGGERPLART